MQIVLIHAVGRNSQTKLGSIMQVLQRYSANILDIEQALVHDSFGLSVLVSIPAGPLHESFLADLQQTCQDIALQVLPITHRGYDSWSKRGGTPKQVITLLGRTVTAAALGELVNIAQNHNLTTDRITRLSGRIALEHQDTSRMVLEMLVFGEQTQAEQTTFHADILHCGRLSGFDAAIQEDNLWRRHRRLVCFDMDSTLIQTEVIDELAKIAGVVEQVQRITEAAMQGQIDFAKSLHARMALLKGIPESQLKQLAEKLPITPGAERLVKTLKKLGFKTAILSGGFDYFAKHLQQRLDIDTVYANTLEVEAGAMTGRIIGNIVDGARKAEKLKEIAKNMGIELAQVVAVGDGANDIPMLSIAGLGVAFQAKPIVLSKTRQHLAHFGLDGVLYLLGLRDEHMELL